MRNTWVSSNEQWMRSTMGNLHTLSSLDFVERTDTGSESEAEPIALLRGLFYWYAMNEINVSKRESQQPTSGELANDWASKTVSKQTSVPTNDFLGMYKKWMCNQPHTYPSNHRRFRVIIFLFRLLHKKRTRECLMGNTWGMHKEW